MKKQLKITDITPRQESFSVPEGYFNTLNEKLNNKLEEEQPLVNIEYLNRNEETFAIPEGYFATLESHVLDRIKNNENEVPFRSRRIRIWGGMVAAACIAMVVVSIIRFGNDSPIQNVSYATNSMVERIPDHEIAALLQERDDEFELTEEELIEVIEHESKQSETTAIIDFLEEDADISGTSQDEFIESI